MTSLMTEPQLGELGQLFKDIMVRIVAVPHLVVLGLALFFAVLSVVFGAPVEIALNFFLEATGAVVALQAKMLLIFGSIGALFYVVGSYRIDILVSYAADKLQSKIRVLRLLWSLMLSGVRTLFSIPAATALWSPKWACHLGLSAGFVPGHSHQLE